MNNKSKKATPKKQTGKAADKPAPVTPDLDKAEALIDKMIADGTFQKMADQQAKIHQERINAIKERNEQERQAKEQKANGDKLLAENAQEQALASMKEYLTLANQNIRTSSDITMAVLAFFDYENFSDNLDYYHVNTPLKVLSALCKPEVIEPLNKEIGHAWVIRLVEILERLVVFTHAIGRNDTSIAELEAVNFELEDYSERGVEHLVIKKSEYDTKIIHLKKAHAVWKAQDEAHKD